VRGKRKETGDGRKGGGKGEWKVNIRRGEPCVRPNRNEQVEKKGDGKSEVRSTQCAVRRKRRETGDTETGESLVGADSISALEAIEKKVETETGEKETGSVRGETHFLEINCRDGWRTVAICP
jgi:hypothetical protein